MTGCRQPGADCFCDSCDHYEAVATQIEYPVDCEEASPRVMATLPPFSVRNPEQHEYWDLSLEEAIRLTLSNSPVIRDVGGRVISAPDTVQSVYDPAIVETNPALGAEAALSAFDTQFETAMLFNRNERTFNSVFFGGGTRGLAQNRGDFNLEFRKTAATGTQFAARNVTVYDRNNSPANLFRSVYDTVFEIEARQPLLQGAGIEFNRIAGPNAAPGSYNGVLLARINTDIELADFEAAVTQLVREVEEAYWQLYFSYRDLDAKIARRDATLQTWRAVRNRFATGFADGEREALAREQYYLAKADVENALNGTPSSGLTVGTSGGVYTVERQLRYLMGLPANDGRLIRPADAPPAVDVVFDWRESLAEALARRVELRRQRWNIRRRELELIAARNFGRMRLDAIGQYRWRGFGDDLLGQRDTVNGSAFGDLFAGNLQGWQLGLQMSTPIGNRIGHSAIRNAELELARSRAIYREQEIRAADELSAAFAELDRSYAVSRSNFNRGIAARRQLEAIRAKYETGTVLLEFVLNAEQRTTEADSAYYRSLVNHNLAITNVHRARGSLLDYYDIHLAEGPWSEDHHASAAKESRRFRPRTMNYCFTSPPNVSVGAYNQEMLERIPAPDAEGVPTPARDSPDAPPPVPPPESSPAGGAPKA